MIEKYIKSMKIEHFWRIEGKEGSQFWCKFVVCGWYLFLRGFRTQIVPVVPVRKEKQQNNAK